ncbi:hypothetical protein HQ535_06035, partial [bacterium]|nr:hypothetical protein [bacterium]
ETGSVAEGSDEMTGVERLDFRAVAIGDKVLIEEDGDVDQVDLDDEIDDRFGVMSVASGGILPTPEMLATLGSSDGDLGSVGDRPANLYAFEGAGAEQFLALFINETVGGGLGGVQALVVRIAVDPSTGVVLEASMEGVFADERDVFTLEMAFTVTALDDSAMTIEFPGLVSGALVPYEDPDGRFTISYPQDWDVDEFGDSTEFTHPAADGVYVTVLVEEAIPGDGSLDAYVNLVFAEAPEDLEILEETTVEHSGFTWQYFDLVYSEDGELIHAYAWLTTGGGTGYALAFAADAGTMTVLALPSIVIEMFETFIPTP